MDQKENNRLPPGRPPWDPWNGARVGGLVGGLVGVGVAVLLGSTAFWLVPLFGAIGAYLGYRSEKRKQTMPIANKPECGSNRVGVSPTPDDVPG